MTVVASAIGFYDGFFGPGTGTFLMMAYVWFQGKNLLEASANSRVINFATNLGAILFFASGGYVEFRFAFPASVAAFVGGLLGAHWAVARGSKVICPVFIAVTWGLIGKVLYDLWTG